MAEISLKKQISYEILLIQVEDGKDKNGLAHTQWIVTMYSKAVQQASAYNATTAAHLCLEVVLIQLPCLRGVRLVGCCARHTLKKGGNI